MSQVSNALQALRDLAKSPPTDVTERRQLYNAARELMFAVETPHEATHRVFYSPIPLHLAKLAIDLRLFHILAEQDSEFSVEELARRTGCDSVLLLRIIRGLASHALISQTTDDRFAANETTKTFTNPGVEGGVYHYQVTEEPVFQNLPVFFNRYGYKNPTSDSTTAFQSAWNTDASIFDFVAQNPEKMNAVIALMTAQRADQKSWIADDKLFPEQYFQLSSDDLANDRAIVVDVGGGAGHQCLALRSQHPELKGRIVLEDLPSTVERVDKKQFADLRIEILVHDFNEPQPVRGAKVYYLRNILHDWPDCTCESILKNVREAMDSDSVLIIDELVVRSDVSSWKQANYDLVMLTVAGMERSKEQFRELFDCCGLDLKETIEYDGETGDSLIIGTPH